MVLDYSAGTSAKDNWLYSDGMLRSNSQYSREIVNMVEPIICCNYVYTHEYCY